MLGFLESAAGKQEMVAGVPGIVEDAENFAGDPRPGQFG